MVSRAFLAYLQILLSFGTHSLVIQCPWMSTPTDLLLCDTEWSPMLFAPFLPSLLYKRYYSSFSNFPFSFYLKRLSPTLTIICSTSDFLLSCFILNFFHPPHPYSLYPSPWTSSPPTSSRSTSTGQTVHGSYNTAISSWTPSSRDHHTRNISSTLSFVQRPLHRSLSFPIVVQFQYRPPIQSKSTSTAACLWQNSHSTSHIPKYHRPTFLLPVPTHFPAVLDGNNSHNNPPTPRPSVHNNDRTPLPLPSSSRFEYNPVKSQSIRPVPT